LRRITQRFFIPGAGKSVIVNGLPSGPITYFGLGRTGIVMEILTQINERLNATATLMLVKVIYTIRIKFSYVLAI
jgi:hypothetical protein